MGKLTVRRAATAPAGKHEDGDGLRLVVTAAGSRSWVLRVTIGGKRKELGLGSFKVLGLAAARAKAAEIRAKVARGEDPTLAVEVPAAPVVTTFTQAAAAYLRAHRRKWTSKRHGRIWARSVATYAKPTFGDKPVGEVTTDDVLRALGPIWLGKTTTAARVRERTEAILDYATVRGWRSGPNPAAWQSSLKYLLPAPGEVSAVVHQPAIPYRDLPDLMGQLEATPGIAAAALRFTVLTAGRVGEVTGATWDEIDLETATWTIPPSRMKARREHVVPLSGAALAILAALPRIHGCPWVFPGRRYGQPLSSMAMLQCLRRCGYGPKGAKGSAVVHGMRSTFADWAAETQPFPRELVEEALAHAVGSVVERSYRRTTLLERRRPLMDAWALHLRGGQ